MQSEFDTSSCAVCGSTAKSACGGCKSIHYCSQEHQKQHWKIHREACTPVKTTFDFQTGKEHYIASRDLKPGTVVLEEPAAFYSPLWYIPLTMDGKIEVDADLDPLCVNCGRLLKIQKLHEDKALKESGIPYSTCSMCTWPVCSKQCENNPTHTENECKLFTEHKITYPPQNFDNCFGDSTTPGIMKLTYLIAMIRGIGLKYQNPQLFHKILESLQDSTLDERLKQNYFRSAMDHVIFLKYLIHNLKCDPTTPVDKLATLPLNDEIDYVTMYRLIQLNQFIVSKVHHMWGDPFPKSALFMYTRANHVSHSCVPNSYWSIGPSPDYIIRIRTCFLVKKGERLTVSRLILPGSHCNVTFTRQMSLTEQGIMCRCDRCTDPAELGLFYSALECPTCKANNRVVSGGANKNTVGYLLPASALLPNTSWKCNNSPDCSYEIDATEYQRRYKVILDEANEKDSERRRENQLGKVKDDYEYWDRIGSSAEEFGETVGLHPNHALVHSVIKTSVVNSCNVDSLEAARPKVILRRMQRLLYCLAIEDKISPGLSVERARLFVIILKLLSRVLVSPEWVRIMSPAEVGSNYNLFKRACRESLKFYKNEFHLPSEKMNVQAEVIGKVMNAIEELKLPWLQNYKQ